MSPQAREVVKIVKNNPALTMELMKILSQAMLQHVTAEYGPPCSEREVQAICVGIERERIRISDEPSAFLRGLVRSPRVFPPRIALVAATKGPRGTVDRVKEFGRPDARAQLRIVR